MRLMSRFPLVHFGSLEVSDSSLPATSPTEKHGFRGAAALLADIGSG